MYFQALCWIGGVSDDIEQDYGSSIIHEIYLKKINFAITALIFQLKGHSRTSDNSFCSNSWYSELGWWKSPTQAISSLYFTLKVYFVHNIGKRIFFVMNSVYAFNINMRIMICLLLLPQIVSFYFHNTCLARIKYFELFGLMLTTTDNMAPLASHYKLNLLDDRERLHDM